MAQAGSNYEKTGGRKSRWTVPLIQNKKLICYHKNACIWLLAKGEKSAKKDLQTKQEYKTSARNELNIFVVVASFQKITHKQ